ncbi:hypothetical protein OG440_39805 (plasmid) [Streptomyces sp. NBC_00637]|uniref:hypothetical protein n=1 Tax=Streptomyces sp. NBC_00637 TaxID=2903667 RepID=UPI002F90A46B
MRAGLFALVGSVLAALGHHAVAEGAVPWRLVSVFAVAQFVLLWPLARRRLTLATVTACTLAAQGSLHLALTWLGGTHHTDSGHMSGPGDSHAAMAMGDGHAWHHSSTAMTAAHVAAALAAGWLLHRADTAIAAALAATRTLHRVAAALLTRLLPPLPNPVPTEPPVLRLAGCLELPPPAWTYTLEHALVRRGPPGRTHVPQCPLHRAAASVRPAPSARSSPCPRITVPERHAASRSPAPPR